MQEVRIMSTHSDTRLALSESVREPEQGVEVKHDYERSSRLKTHVEYVILLLFLTQRWQVLMICLKITQLIY